MRICHVLGDSAFGGGSKIVGALVAQSIQEGHQVYVLTTNPPFMRYVESMGATVVPLDCIWRPIRPLRDLRGLWKLKKHLESQPYDLVHTHTSKAGFVGRVSARWARIPAIVHTVHGFSFHEKTPVLSRAFQVAMERIAARHCDRIVTVSHFHYAWATELGIAPQSKLLAIPNGIQDPRSRTRHDGMELRCKLGVQHSELMVFSAGRLVTGKGLIDLCKAISFIRQQNRWNIKLFIAGEGPLRQELEEFVRRTGIEQRVVFLGFRDDIAALMEAADIFVLPTQREGLSIVLLEALATGSAIVASDIGSNREAGEGAALFFPYGDHRRLAESVLRLADDSSLRRRIGKRARQRFMQRYSEVLMVDAYSQLYSEVLPLAGPATTRFKKEGNGR